MKEQFLPLFPLKLVVYPKEVLKLHIFEPRYKQLINECFAQQKSFGIPTYINNQIGEYGTEVNILSVDNVYANGEMDVRTQGARIFRIHEFFQKAKGKLYANGQVEYLENIDNHDTDLQMQIVAKLQELYQVLGTKKDFGSFRSFDIAHHIGFTEQQEYDLLQVQKEQQRQQIIIQHLNHIVPIIIETERLKAKIKMNGHFKNLNPLNF